MTRRKTAIVTMTTALLGTVIGMAAPASAQPAPDPAAGVVATGGVALNVRSTPSTSRPVVGALANGSRLRIVCQKPGQLISGHVRRTRMWNRLPTGRYVTDAYVRRSGVRPPRCEDTAKKPGAPAPWVAPVDAPVGSGFRGKDRPTHDGVDLSAKRNSRIRAVAAGEVVVAMCNITRGKSCNVDGSPTIRGCGWYVDIVHSGGVRTRYCHMVRQPEVKVGQKVSAGQIIGHVGSSGNSSGPHLHFETHLRRPVEKGSGSVWEPVDPVKFMAGKGVKLR